MPEVQKESEGNVYEVCKRHPMQYLDLNPTTILRLLIMYGKNGLPPKYTANCTMQVSLHDQITMMLFKRQFCQDSYFK
jgi:hypothetical protein